MDEVTKGLIFVSIIVANILIWVAYIIAKSMKNGGGKDK